MSDFQLKTRKSFSVTNLRQSKFSNFKAIDLGSGSNGKKIIISPPGEFNLVAVK